MFCRQEKLNATRLGVGTRAACLALPQASMWFSCGSSCEVVPGSEGLDSVEGLFVLEAGNGNANSGARNGKANSRVRKAKDGCVSQSDWLCTGSMTWFQQYTVDLLFAESLPSSSSGDLEKTQSICPSITTLFARTCGKQAYSGLHWQKRFPAHCCKKPIEIV